MKQRILLLSFFIFPLLVSAQCKDCSEKDTDWKFAAGVTLYSNNMYVSQYKLLERQPFEVNFRYKLGKNHIIRFSTPLAWKVKETKSPLTNMPNYELDESLYNKALAYYIAMKNDEVYSDFVKVERNDYNLFGGSIGYDYNMSLGYGISVAAGIDLSYYNYKSTEKFYGIGYSVPDKNDVTKIEFIDYTERTNECKAFAAKPQVCLRYQFQRLLLEGSIGYTFTISNMFAEIKSQSPGSNEDFYGSAKRNYDFNRMVYQLSLFYTL
jgi:hypothetical protein